MDKSPAIIATNVVVTELPTGFGFDADLFNLEIDRISGRRTTLRHEDRWAGIGARGRWKTAAQAELWGEAACAEANATGTFPNLCDVVFAEPVQIKSRRTR